MFKTTLKPHTVSVYKFLVAAGGVLTGGGKWECAECATCWYGTFILLWTSVVVRESKAQVVYLGLMRIYRGSDRLWYYDRLQP